jgi:hypothetical protein
MVIPQVESAAIEALSAVLPIVGRFRDLFRGDKIQVNADGTINIRSTDYTGVRRMSRYRYTRGKHPLVWEDGPGDA